MSDSHPPLVSCRIIVAQSLDFCFAFSISLLAFYMLTIISAVPFNTQLLITPHNFASQHIFTICQRLFQQYSSNIVRVSRFYTWWKPEYPEKTTDIQEVTDTIYHIMLYRLHFALLEFKRKALVVIGTDCIGSSTYHTFTTTMAHAEILEVIT